MGLLIRHGVEHFSISLLFLILCSSPPACACEGRVILQALDHSKTAEGGEKGVLSSEIGSRPPRCERSCSSCGHCEAIQVPTNPQVKQSGPPKSSSASVVFDKNGDYGSNYKPMSWKCKCGNLIFNP